MKFYDKAPITTITLNAGQEVIITENPPAQPPVETDQITTLSSPQLNKRVQPSDFSEVENHKKPILIADDEDWFIDSKADQPLTRIERNEQTPDSQKALMDLIEMFIKISPHLIDFIKAFKTGNPKVLSPLLDIDGIKEILPLFLPLLKQVKPSMETEDIEQFTKDVWEKILDLGKSTFRKVELTKALQAKYKADVIQKALEQLEEIGRITHIKEKKKVGVGAKKSPLYRVNAPDNYSPDKV